MDASLIGPLGAVPLQPQDAAKIRTLLLHNPKAGDGTLDAETLAAALARSGCDVAHCTKQDDGLKDALAGGWDLVAVAGGDGTVAKAARKMGDHSIPLAILPMGTANNVARSLGITAKPEELAANLRGAASAALDVGLAKGPWGKRGFVEAVGLGAVAQAIANSGPKPSFEHRIRLGREGLRNTLAAARPYPLSVRIDGNTIAGDYLLVEALNLCFSGPQLPLAHRADAGDRLLDVVFLTEDDRKAVLEWIAEAPELEPPPLKLVQGREVEFRWEDAPLRIDDRVYTPPKEGATVRLGLGGALRVLRPELNGSA